MNKTPSVELTMLNSMASPDLGTAMDCHVEWNVRLLDLKDNLFGKNIASLDLNDAHRIRVMAEERRLKVYCLSSGIFHRDIEAGQAGFQKDLEALDGLIKTARELKPSVIRLLSATTTRRGEFTNYVSHLIGSHPWVINCYRRAIDRIVEAGFTPMIENEAWNAIFSTESEILQFFEALDRPAARFIWDAGNLWEMGTRPSLEVYERLRPVIGGLHLKGARAAEDAPDRPHWASPLEDAAWPVVQIVKKAAHDGNVSVVCINSPHGKRIPADANRNFVTDDISFLRRSLPDIVS